MKKVLFGFLLFSLSLEWLSVSMSHIKHHAWWEGIPAFFALFGFVGAVLLIFGANFLGKKILANKDNRFD